MIEAPGKSVRKDGCYSACDGLRSLVIAVFLPALILVQPNLTQSGHEAMKHSGVESSQKNRAVTIDEERQKMDREFALLVSGRLEPCENRQNEADYLRFMSRWFIKGFQKSVSRIDGDRCDHVPRCTEYGLLAVQKHGIVMGSLLVVDRLLRESGGQDDYRRWIMIDGDVKPLDTLSDNDWWLITSTGEKEMSPLGGGICN